jgi:hypothetical protein
MKNKSIRKIISALVAGILTIQGIPFAASAETTQVQGDTSIVLEAAKDNVPVRTEPSKHGDVVETLDESDCIQASGSVVNEYGNTWWVIDAGDESYYVYDGNVKEHTHTLLESEDASLQYCRCGWYQYTPTAEDGVQRLGAAAATAGSLLGASALGDLDALAAAVASAGLAAAGTVFTVVSVVVISGTIFYIIINASTTRAEISSIVKSMEEFDAEKNETGKYYYAAQGATSLMIYYGESLNIEQANEYLVMKATSNSLLDGVAIQGIYTVDPVDATALAIRYTQNTGLGSYDYGNSKGADSFEYDKNQNGTFKIGHFAHYHISYSTDLGAWKKKNVHIWFGEPYGVKLMLPMPAA